MAVAMVKSKGCMEKEVREVMGSHVMKFRELSIVRWHGKSLVNLTSAVVRIGQIDIV